jgi:hypothetical protein
MSEKTSTTTFNGVVDQIRVKIAAKVANRRSVKESRSAWLADLRKQISRLAARTPDCDSQARAFAEEAARLHFEEARACDLLEKGEVYDRLCREVEAVETARAAKMVIPFPEDIIDF